MKRLYKGLLLLTIAAAATASCVENKKNDQTKAEETPVVAKTTPSADDYNPGEAWTLAWADEFEGDTLNTDNWNLQVEPAGRFNEEWQRYTNSENNAYVENGHLVIKAIHESDEHGMDQYTSARLNTANKQFWKYGKIAARIKLPYGKGMWPAFWMLGNNINENGGDTPWPQSGEIDILEMYGSKDNGVVEANLHYANLEDKHTMMGAVPFKLKEGAFADDFHIFALEWDEMEISWLVDGEKYHTAPITDEALTEFHEDFFILFNLAVGGAPAGEPDESTEFPQYMKVDWVRVYKK